MVAARAARPMGQNEPLESAPREARPTEEAPTPGMQIVRTTIARSTGDPMTMHAGLASGRWWTLTLAEQLGNAGADVSRAVRARQEGDQGRFDAALDRALELLDLTLADPRWRGPRLRHRSSARQVAGSIRRGWRDDPGGIGARFARPGAGRARGGSAEKEQKNAGEDREDLAVDDHGCSAGHDPAAERLAHVVRVHRVRHAGITRSPGGSRPAPCPWPADRRAPLGSLRI